MSDQLNRLIDEWLAETCQEHPERATNLGIDGFEHRLGTYGAADFARRDEQVDDWHRRFSALADDGLTLDEQIDRDLVLSGLRGEQLARDWAVWKRNPATYLNPGLNGVFTLFLHRPLPEPDLAAAAAARMREIPRVLEDGKANLDPALAPPLFVERAIDQCRAAVRYVREMVPADVAPEHREPVAEAGEIAARAYEDFLTSLEKLRADATGSWAIGEDLYSAILTEEEMLGYGAREMLERGREAFAELEKEMSRRSRDLNGSDDWRETLERLNKEHPETPDEMRDIYAEWTERARQFLIDRELVTMPEGERCLVEPSPPFQRPVLAVASYSSPPPFKPSMTGHFFVPYPPDGTPPDEVKKRLESNSMVAIPTTAVHEAYPGHHWHLVWAQQNPRTARKVLGTSYFAEGWALYSEIVMLEQGFYDDPRHELGVIEARIFRAARIIVDTSLHIGEMSFDDALGFMLDTFRIGEPTLRSEVGRYCSWPTQASSYLTGSLEIERMRKRWLEENKGLREFHDRIAGSGALPTALAERAVFG